MKPLLLATLLPISALAAGLTEEQEFYVLWSTETRGRWNAPDGDLDKPGGPSIGPFQIQRAYWRDSGVAGDWQDCRDLEYAKKVVRAYWKRYGARGIEDRFRLHNGGPSRRGTDQYWKKAREIMRNEFGDEREN